MLDIQRQHRGFSWIELEDLESAASSFLPDFYFIVADRFLEREERESYHRAAPGATPIVTVDGPLGLRAQKIGWWDTFLETALVKEDPHDPWDQRFYDAEIGVLSDQIQTLCAQGADVVFICDDLAGRDGYLLDPAFITRALLPAYRCLADRADSLGLTLCFHSDGDISRYYADLKSYGYRGVHVSHTEECIVQKCFALAREHDLVPFGGVVMQNIFSRPLEEVLRFIHLLTEDGACCICDDGGMTQAKELHKLVRVLGYTG